MKSKLLTLPIGFIIFLAVVSCLVTCETGIPQPLEKNVDSESLKSDETADVESKNIVLSEAANSSSVNENQVNGTEIVQMNVGEKNTSVNATTEGKSKLKVECSHKVLPENEIPTVLVSNSSALLEVLTPSTTNASTGDCVVVLFYSSQCVFSARMGPHYNALPRVFPDVTFYAVDVIEHSNLYIRFGLVYVPNVMLFHNAKPIARFNETTLNLEHFVKFINRFTGLEHNGTLNVTSPDMNGPVPATITKKVDYLLVLAWIFMLSCLCFGFAKSALCQHIVEFLKNTWQEAEAQHQHED